MTEKTDNISFDHAKVTKQVTTVVTKSLTSVARVAVTIGAKSQIFINFKII